MAQAAAFSPCVCVLLPGNSTAVGAAHHRPYLCALCRHVCTRERHVRVCLPAA